MRLANLKSLSSKILVEDYIVSSLWMFEESDNLDASEYNKHFEQNSILASELKSRSGDHRRALLPLLKHENPQVKLNAADDLAAIEPLAARKAYQEIIALDHQPQSGDAIGALRILNGEFKLKDINWPN